MTDDQHRQWFEHMVQKDPMWVFALPFVQGGRKEFDRYNKTVSGGRY
jgi:hypothetical protein